MRKNRKFFLPVILLWVLALGFWAYYVYTKPHESTKNLNADLTINADELYKQYSVNETEADKKYLNKIIKVEGKISEIKINGTVQIFVLETQSAGGINCQMSSSEIIKKTGVEKGATVSIKGRCTGFLMDVNLVDCVVE
jgi:hypothetical protein